MRKHNLPIVICEGAKKAASLLSAGYVAIALPGVWNGRRKGSDLTPERLIPDLNHFATKRRKIYFCFDHDEKPKTVRHVNLAIAKTGKLFSEAGCDVRVILLPGPEKGVDDFIVTQGADAFEPLYKCALALESWQWHVRYRSRRTIQPWKTIEQAKLDLRTVGEMPERGVLFLESAKGTGKTHSISRLIRDRSKVVLLTHRIGLGRNLGQRFGVDWRTDLDRGFGGWIADGSRHTSRIGLCVDSLLAIDPQHFWDCDLVIDEIDQVLNHLLTSSTCNRDGKRPALLARLHEFIHVARRVIVASADITDDEIDYLKSLVESDVPVRLIRNTHIPDGYETTILDSKNESTAIAELLNSLAVGKKVFVATDSLQSSKAIAELLKQFQRTHPKFQFLTINSETSGGDIEAEFIRNVNECVRAFDCVVATPSLTTGISIDVEHFDLVVGLFRGVLDDADIAQALARVRPPIPRLVWCANSGKGFSKVSRSDTPSLLKAAIKTQWDRETRLMRTSLRPDISPLVEDNFDWDNNPHLNHWCRLVAHHNAALWNLRVNLIERLRWEGNQVNVLFVEENPVIGDRLKLAKKTAKAQRCRAIAEARTLSPSEMKALQAKDSRLPTDILNEQKTRLAEFYCDEDITPELVAFDDRGKLRGQIVELE
ncbi:MAG: plasmid replication protein, CyRepA1 family, partial [Cyanobacteria bacterium J06642_2]